MASSVNAQLSFFACRNHLIDMGIRRDFNKYLYCQEFGVPPHKGDYGSQPALWVDKCFLFKKILAKKEQSLIHATRESNNKGRNIRR